MEKILVTVLILVLCMVCSTSACSCLQTSSRNQYCDADFVILARIIQTEIDETDQISGKTYTVEVLVSFKGTLVAGSIRHIISAVHGATCGVSLQDGGYYLLAGHEENGGTLRINLCGWNKKWSELTNNERRRLWRKSYYCGRPLPIRRPIETITWPPTIFEHKEHPFDIMPSSRPRRIHQIPRGPRLRLRIGRPSFETINRINTGRHPSLNFRNII